MSFSVRQALQEDSRGITLVLRSVEWFEELRDEPLEKTTERVARHLALCLTGDSHFVWVAEDSASQIAAYASVHWLPYLFLDGPEGYLSELFVHAQARGKGIGTLLLAGVKEEARRRGCSRLLLENNRTRDSYLRGFYLKDGWEERTRMASFVYDLAAHNQTRSA